MKVKNIVQVLARFARAKEAVSALEYAIVVSVVAAGIGGAVYAFTGSVGDAVNTIGDKVKTTASSAPTGPIAPTPSNT